MDLVPDTQQLAQAMSQATAPAFVLGAVAGFISILLGRMTTIVDRIRGLNGSSAFIAVPPRHQVALIGDQSWRKTRT